MTHADEWTGPVGDVWAAEWQRTDRSFADLAPRLNAAILEQAPSGTATIVDIGCGAGATSIAIATALPSARVTGIDISPGLIEVAAERGRALPNLSFLNGPVEERIVDLPPVDLFLSRHGVMFFADPVFAFTALRRAAAPGARLVFSCFRAPALNPWAVEIVSAVTGAPPLPLNAYAPGPFAFADPDVITRLLESAGWSDIICTPVDFTFRTGQGDDPVADAIGYFQRIGPAAALLRAASDAERPPLIERIAAVAERHRIGDAVDFPAAAWLCSARMEE